MQWNGISEILIDMDFFDGAGGDLREFMIGILGALFIIG